MSRPSRCPLAGDAASDLTTPDLPAARPSAAAVLRRSLVVWGLGHLALGDRRGLFLLILQPVLLVGLLLLSLQLMDGTRWLIIFPPLAFVLVLWLAQAVHAYQLALRLGAEPRGEAQVALFLPVAVALLTLYWLYGGSHGSPTATVEEYALDWMASRSTPASQLFVTPPSTDALDAQWQAEDAYLQARVADAAERFGPGSGLHPETPFANLRFNAAQQEHADVAVVTIEIVRQREIQTTILGIIPTASQETVSVEEAGVITVRLVPEQPLDWLPMGQLGSSAWLIEDVAIPGPSAIAP